MPEHETNTRNGHVPMLIVDDETVVRRSLTEWFRDEGYAVQAAADAAEALERVEATSFAVALVDVRMPGTSGLELQKRLQEIAPELIVIVITAYATVETAVQALKQGAYDYVTKPVDPDRLAHLVRNALAQRRLAKEKLRLEGEISRLGAAGEFVGESDGARKVMELVEAAAPTENTVMIRGESGTGKELVARALHMQSRRRYFPFVPVNCGGLSEAALRVELFGREAGDGEDASDRRQGKLELAHGGTVFLDEVGQISPGIQAELQQVLESKRFIPAGESDPRPVDFRTVCATRRDLEVAVRQNEFREDLFYQLNMFVIHVPPLRERRTDIALLARYFLEKYARQTSKGVADFEPDALRKLEDYRWPGNVRELENAVERAVVVCPNRMIRTADLPGGVAMGDASDDDLSLDAMEKRHVAQVLRQTGGNVARAARILDINRVTLYNKIKKYGLR
jgi:DNA-binding NtrC family response regulator